jgi:hypothetical protein
MGKTFHLFSTDPVVRRRLQEAQQLRNAYLRAALAGLLRRCVVRLTRLRQHASANPVPLPARIDPGR